MSARLIVAGELRARGYEVAATGDGERIPPTGITERFCMRPDGQLEPVDLGLHPRGGAGRDACRHRQDQAIRFRPSVDVRTPSLKTLTCCEKNLQTAVLSRGRCGCGVPASRAHVEPPAAAEAFHVMIGLGPSDAVGVLTRFRHLQRL
jgi:hypothetical protein